MIWPHAMRSDRATIILTYSHEQANYPNFLDLAHKTQGHGDLRPEWVSGGGRCDSGRVYGYRQRLKYYYGKANLKFAFQAAPFLGGHGTGDYVTVVADTVRIVVYTHCLKRFFLVLGLNNVLYAFGQMPE